MPGTRWLTFDCYGTIADWNSCMRSALETRVGATTAQALLVSYSQAELVMQASPSWRPYREILGSGLSMAMQRNGVSFDEDPARVLLEAWPDMRIFDDAPEALRELKSAGWRLAILANCDQEQFAMTAEQLPVQFDVAVTADQVRSYKPDLGHFRRFAQITGATPASWIHIGNSWVQDILAAKRMGLRSIWIDREHTGHPAKFAERRITAMHRLPMTVRDVNVLPAWEPS